ncbi:diguanylate cyclase (GGDEF)-like protein [Amorphus suaedae]
MRVRPIYLIIIGIAVVVQIGLVSIDTFDKLYAYSRSHESYEIDEAFTIFFVLTLALAAVLIVRTRDLQREIRYRRKAEETAALLARRDALTGLPNRRLLQEEFEYRLGRVRGQGQQLGVLLLDLDRFKIVNDTYGHSAGDHLLQVVSDRITSVLREKDFLARLGGDEFAILIDTDPETDALFRIAQRILTSVAVPFEAEGGAFSDVTVSIGIAVYPGDGETTEVLLKRADQAMYQAKAAGRNTYALYDKALGRILHERLETERELRAAVRDRQIFPFYQPLFDLTEMKPVGIEALARWQHPTRGVLDAEQFIGLAEDSGLIGDVFTMMLEQVCIDARSWQIKLPIAVNVSPSQFRDVLLAEKIIALLERHQFDPRYLEIEVTETALLVDVESTRRTLAALKKKGIRIALDDFGTGYASLRQLRELPFDTVKIDGSFIHRLSEDEESRKIVTSIIGLGQALGLATIAEGIESAEEAKWVKEQGCPFGQGYQFVRPVAAHDLEAALEAFQGRQDA